MSCNNRELMHSSLPGQRSDVIAFWIKKQKDVSCSLMIIFHHELNRSLLIKGYWFCKASKLSTTDSVLQATQPKTRTESGDFHSSRVHLEASLQPTMRCQPKAKKGAAGNSQALPATPVHCSVQVFLLQKSPRSELLCAHYEESFY